MTLRSAGLPSGQNVSRPLDYGAPGGPRGGALASGCGLFAPGRRQTASAAATIVTIP
jgi:hypothetical protein